MGLEKKKVSKRIPLRKKYKIKKRMAEHNRKIRQAAKKNPSFVQKKLNKAVGGPIPNLWPFKEELLKSMQERKEMRIEENMAAQKEARHKEIEKKRKLVTNPDLHIYAAQSLDKDLAFERKEDHLSSVLNDVRTTSEPKDTSMGAYYKEFKKVIEAADVIIEVLDARDPMGCRCPDVENTIATKYPNKRIVLLLNKIDLVPRHNVEKWMAYLRNVHPTVAFKSSTQRKGKISQSENTFKHANESDLQNSESLGADALLQLLKHYSRTGGVHTSITVGIIGFPNVGKSSVINSLCRVRAAKVGATPGVTKTAQEIHLDKRVKLLDTPGIVFPKPGDVSDDVILRNVVKVEQVADPISPVSLILQRCNKHVILSIYKIPDFNNTNEFLAHLARKIGKLSRGGIPNLTAAAKIVLRDWTGGKIPFYTDPPAVKPSVHVAASIVDQFAPDFDVAQSDVLKNLNGFNQDAELYATSLGTLKPVASNNPFTAPPMDMDDSSNAGDVDDYEDDEDDEEEEEEEEEDLDDEVIPAAAFMTNVSKTSKTTPNEGKPTKKQDLTDEADKHNPQTNKSLKKKQKQAQKKNKKETKKKTGTVGFVADAPYSFATDYMDDDEDIDADEIDTQ